MLWMIDHSSPTLDNPSIPTKSEKDPEGTEFGQENVQQECGSSYSVWIRRGKLWIFGWRWVMVLLLFMFLWCCCIDVSLAIQNCKLWIVFHFSHFSNKTVTFPINELFNLLFCSLLTHKELSYLCILKKKRGEWINEKAHKLSFPSLSLMVLYETVIFLILLASFIGSFYWICSHLGLKFTSVQFSLKWVFR